MNYARIGLLIGGTIAACYGMWLIQPAYAYIGLGAILIVAAIPGRQRGEYEE